MHRPILNKDIEEIDIIVVHKIYARIESYITILNRALERLNIHIEIVPDLNFSNNKYDIIHLHWPHELYKDSKFPVLAVFSITFRIIQLKLKGKKFVWTVHNVLPHNLARIPYLDLAFRLFLIKTVDRFLVHNNYTAKWLLTHGADPGKIVHINFPSYSKYYKKQIPKKTARRMLDIDQNKKILLFFGRIRPYKGFDTLIETFKKLPSDYVLLLTGVPAGRDWNFEKNKKIILALIKPYNNILPFLRWIEDSEVHVFFSAVDCVIIPFKQITTSGSLFLAQAFSKPVIAPDIDSIGEYLDSRSGILYDPSQKNALLNAIYKLSTKDLRHMGIEAKKRDRRNNPLITAKQIRKTYESVLRENESDLL